MRLSPPHESGGLAAQRFECQPGGTVPSINSHDPCPADRPGRIAGGNERDHQTSGAALIRHCHRLINRRSLAVTGQIALIACLVEPTVARTLRVGVSGSAPFVIQDPLGDGLSGISIDVWRRVAEANDLPYDFIRQSSTDAGIAAVEAKKIDVLIGPVSVTASRLARPEVDFTQPYFIGRTGVLLPLQRANLSSRLQVLFGRAVISSVLMLGSVLLVVGTFIWLVEHRQNPEHFPPRPLPGIASGMWFALVTLTTVGYGDKAPITRTGRSITAAWMVMSLVAVSTLTAGLASAFTVLLSGSTQEKVKDPGELALLRVAAVNGTSGMELAERRKLRIVAAESLDKGIEAVLNNTADALIFDRPALRYHLKLNPDLAVRVAPFTLAEETYGFVLRWDDRLRTPLDVSILKLQRQGLVEAMVNVLMN